MYPLVKNILIADDHPLIRRGLRMLIGNELKLTSIKEVSNFTDLLRELETNEYTHLVLDLSLSQVNAAVKFGELRKTFPALAILIYSMHPSEIYGSHLIRLGARGYLNKQCSDEEVINCLKEFFSGRKCIEHLHGIANGSTKYGNPFNLLSQQELEVLPHLLQGFGIKEIAATMKLRPNTVGTFKTRIFEKLQVKNLIELNELASIYQLKVS